jgi:hypothetical protein
MGQWPTRGDEKLPLVLLSFVIEKEVSSRPERTRISCHAALDNAAPAPFRKEGRINCDNATRSNRKSGVAKRRDLLCALPSLIPGQKKGPFLAERPFF